MNLYEFAKLAVTAAALRRPLQWKPKDSERWRTLNSDEEGYIEGYRHDKVEFRIKPARQ